MEKKSQNSLVIAIIASMLMWGLSWPSGKVLANYSSSATNYNVYRYIVALLSLFFTLLFLRVPIMIRKQGIPFVVVSGLLLALYSILFFRGIKTGFAGAGGVLVTTMNPIMAYSIGLIMSRKMPSGKEAIGLGLGLVAGSVLLRIWENTDALFATGNLYFLLAAFLWAIMSKFTSKAVTYGSSMGFSLWQYLVTFFCFLPLFDVKEMETTLAAADALFWITLLFSAAIVTGLATTLYFYATTRLGAERASSFIFIVPFAAALSSWFFLDEKILMHTIVGGALGIAAVYIINSKKP